MEENILENKIRAALPKDKLTAKANEEIEKLKFFISRLEKMDPSLAKEFLEIIDNIILKGNIDVIIKEDIKVKKKGI